jgi:hypothetical protein
MFFACPCVAPRQQNNTLRRKFDLTQNLTYRAQPTSAKIVQHNKIMDLLRKNREHGFRSGMKFQTLKNKNLLVARRGRRFNKVAHGKADPGCALANQCGDRSV